MKAAVSLPGCPLEALPHPESRHTVLTKLETNQYVLRVPRGGKSAVWKIFLHVTNLHEHKIDFVLCRYCCGLFMYKGYASGTSSLMNHGIRCLDRPKKPTPNNESNNNSPPINEEWPEAFKSRPYFTLNYLKRFKAGDTRSPSPVTPLKYNLSFKVETPYQAFPMESAAGITSSPTSSAVTSPINYHSHQHQQQAADLSSVASAGHHLLCESSGGSSDSGVGVNGRQHTDTLEQQQQQLGVGLPPLLQHFYAALHVAAHSFGVPVESLLKLAGRAY